LKRSNARIHCFEPQPDSFKKLAERTKPYASRVQLYNYGLYDHAGPATFHVSAYRDASSLLDKGVGDTTDITVALMRLDDVVASDSVEKIDFMKIDTEGAELGVIKGGPMAFKDKILSAYIEIQPQFKGYYSSAHIELFQSLHDFGFGFAGVFGDDYFFSKLLPRSKNN
jgi:FkbM family methyltransferase